MRPRVQRGNAIRPDYLVICTLYARFTVSISNIWFVTIFSSLAYGSELDEDIDLGLQIH